MAVPAGTIVEHLDVIEYICTGHVKCFIDSSLDAFLLQAAEEGLSDCIVPAVASSAHAGLQVVGLQKAQPAIAAIF